MRSHANTHCCTAHAGAPPPPLTLSHALSGRLGLLERESVAILNATLQPLAARVLTQYTAAMRALGLGGVPLHLSANDGTLLQLGAAAAHPVLTCRSGPVKSLRGAAAPAGLADALVVDIGGSTMDGNRRVC